MKNINTYLKEGLKINKNLKFDKHVYSDEELKDSKLYTTCDIPELDELIDDKLKELNNRNSNYPYSKRKTKYGNNVNWYSFYCYLYYNGPSKKEDVVKGVKGNTPSHYHELFTDLKIRNILSNPSRGVWETEHPKNWK